MDDRRIEERLREVPLAEPPPELRERILRAAAERPRRSRWAAARAQWALAAAAALLIAANLVFAHVHEARMAALMGGSQGAVAQHASPADAAAYAQAIQERERLMSEMLATPHIDADGGEPDGTRQLPDLQTNRAWDRRVECV